MPRERPLAVGTELRGKTQKHPYRIKRLVGGGGMAWVYQVECLEDGDGSLWALKELRPQTEDPDTQAHARVLFDQEAQILQGLDHPNLPQVIDFFEEQGRAYLVMEFIWGESLEKRLEQARSPLMEREVLQWAVQICDVLDYLHCRRPPVIFRDLKPSNVMVNSAGVVKLVDFGIARTYKEDKLQDTIALGSENYAAPEQWGQAQTDARSDIYGLGATMYHLLARHGGHRRQGYGTRPRRPLPDGAGDAAGAYGVLAGLCLARAGANACTHRNGHRCCTGYGCRDRRARPICAAGSRIHARARSNGRPTCCRGGDADSRATPRGACRAPGQGLPALPAPQ
jgi:hypothetical protein